VPVWVYANVPTVELFLNGTSLGTKHFDRKVTTFGQAYLETTEPTGDDYNYPSGSYTSPNGSTGKLHLTWIVPFAPGVLTAVASAGGAQVARDRVLTAGPARALVLAPDKRALAADGSGVSFVAASVVDARGTIVPGAETVISFRVSGPGTIAGTDNGRQENAARYQATDVAAFGGRAVAVVRAGREPGTIRVTATSPGLAAANATLEVAGRRGAAVIAGTGATASAIAVGAGAAGSTAVAPATVADASYSGAPNTIPAMMLDGDLSTGWSNFYDKSGTANLHAVSASHASDWVSLSWPDSPRRIGSLVATFTTGGPLSLPASIAVTYWNGRKFVPVRNLTITWATASNQPTAIAFDPVVTSQVKLTMTSPAPGAAAGFLQIAELQAVIA